MKTACTYLMKAAVLCYSFVSFAGELAEMRQDEDFLKVMSIVTDSCSTTLTKEDDYLDCYQEIVHSVAGKLDDQWASQKALFDVCVDNANRYNPSDVNETEEMMKTRFKVDTAVTLLLIDHDALKETVDGILRYAQQRVLQRKYGSSVMLEITTAN